MTYSLPSSLKKTLLAAGALTVLAAAPAAMAAPAVSTDAPVSANYKAELTLVAESRPEGHYKKRHRSDRNRSHHRRSDRHRSKRHGHRGYHRDRGYRRSDYRHTRRHYRPKRHYYKHHRPHYRKHWKHYKRHAGYYTPYKSNIGISFHLGSPGYSSYRWAQNPYSFYNAGYGSYGYYQSSTTCRRVTVEGWHHGHRELVSVKQCSNPWDGTYIVQGSERVINCTY